MKNFFDKEIAAEHGFEVALDLAAGGAQIQAELASIDTISKMQGRPSLEQEEARDLAEFVELMDEFSVKGFDPDLVAMVRGR